MLEKSWLKYGLILGIVSIVMTVVKYYIFPFNTFLQLLIGIVITIVLGVMAAREEREEKDGFLEYGEALMTVFFTFLIGTLISSIFLLVVSNWIDPSVKDKMVEDALSSTKWIMEKMNTPEDAIAEGMEKAEEKVRASFSVSSQLMSIFTSSIVSFILAAIVAIFVKNVKKEENYL